MIPNTPAEEIWGYRWQCACGKVAIKSQPTEPPKCSCKKKMVHQIRPQPQEKKP